jgi:hypothetical protein
MRPSRYLLVCTLLSVARISAAQLTARDSAALVEAIADRIYTQFGTGAAREPFVMVGGNRLVSAESRFAMRISDAVRARDSSLIVAEPTRSTKRILFRKLELVAGDTASVVLWVARYTGSSPIYSSHDATVAFRHAGNRWTFVERNVGGAGTGANGCPW